MKRYQFYILLTLSICLPCAVFAIGEYEVVFKGDISDYTLELLKNASQLYKLKKNPPPTFSGLKRRAESDSNNLVKALHSAALYNARITFEYQFEKAPYQVIVMIDPGPVYLLKSIEVKKAKKSADFPYELITPSDICLCLNEPALPKTIRKAETNLIKFLNYCGYPYAKLKKTEVIADQQNQNVHVNFIVDSGPKYLFGCINMSGLKRVKSTFLLKKVAWREGQIYCPQKIDRTLRELELSGLFSYVDISFPNEPPQGNELPVTIDLKESKARTIGFGINYATQRGPGVSGEWEHRNFNGNGEVLSIRSSLWSDRYYARLSYLQPERPCKSQDVVWLAEINREENEGYTAYFFSLSSRIDWRISNYSRMSYGIMYKHLLDTDVSEAGNPEDNGMIRESFDLFKLPIYYNWSNADNSLNPSCGMAFQFSTIPSWQFLSDQFVYSINMMTLSGYFPLRRDKKLIVAARTVLGSIVGPSRKTIPRSELFDAGSEALLRGYKYKTVSPIDQNHEPTGGRSLFINSLELRWRSSETIGWVLFYDFGNVYAAKLPNFDQKFLHSTGIGFRYFTPVAPIRIDLAFPLNFRKGVDKSHYQVYLSIGQAF